MKRFYRKLLYRDRIQIQATAGRGGNGVATFRREKFIPKGGPDGGDGGRGGNVLVRCSKDKTSLFHLKNQVNGGSGATGMGKKRHGSNGKDAVLEVPLGTIVRRIIHDDWVGRKRQDVVMMDDGTVVEFLADMSRDGEELIVCSGGKGGKGNVHWKSSINQAPQQFSPGMEGESCIIDLELKSIADIGLLGYPNAGKSTTLSKLSNAKPKIASYPFTTLNPVIGVMEFESGDEISHLTVADIPGLIEGASQNVGLGHDFLRHVERTKALCYVIDMSGDDHSTTEVSNRQALSDSFAAEPLNLSYRDNVNRRDASVELQNALNNYQISIDNVAQDYGFDEFLTSDEKKESFPFAKMPRKKSKRIKEKDPFQNYNPIVNKHLNQIQNRAQYDYLTNSLRYELKPWTVLEKLEAELENYQQGLSQRVCLIIANKMDLEGAEENLQILKTKTDLPIFPISSKFGEASEFNAVKNYMKYLVEKTATVVEE